MEKHLERQKKQEAEEAAAAEAAARKAEEDAKAAEVAAEARKQRQIEKKATQKERSRLRGLTAGQGAPCPSMLRLQSACLHAHLSHVLDLVLCLLADNILLPLCHAYRSVSCNGLTIVSARCRSCG